MRTTAAPMAIVSRHRAWLTVSAAAAALSAPCLAAPTLFWASSPTLPDETLLIHGAGFQGAGGDAGALSVTVRVLGTKDVVPVTPEYVNVSAMAIVIPPPLPVGAYEVSVGGATVTVNAPDFWWAQGDGGETVSPGGWIRVFGKSIQLAGAAHADALRQAERGIRAAVARRDFDAVATLLQARAGARASLAAAPPVQLRLTPSSIVGDAQAAGTPAAAPVVLTAEPANTSCWDAVLMLPASVAPGVYTVELSNGLGGSEAPWVPLDAFIDPTRPRVSTVTVAPTAAYPDRVFNVADYNRTFNDTYLSGEPYNRSLTGSIGTHWDVPLNQALAAARAAGGGTVVLPAGMLYLTGSIRVPHNVLLKGAGTELTSIHFREVWDKSELPVCYDDPKQPAVYICSDVPGDNHTEPGTTVRWGVEDLTIYVTGLHNDVIATHNKTDGFSLRRVRARVDALFMQGNFPGGHEQDVVNGTKVLRPLNITPFFTSSPPGNFLLLHGRNWDVSDNDIFSDATPVYSFGWDAAGQRHSAAWGRLQRNTLHHSVACHPMDAWQQVIIEDNLCHGVSLLAGGNALGTSAGGFAQHVYSHRNRMESEWSADREVITFDDAGGSWLGPIRVVGTAVRTAGATKPCATDRLPFGWEGGSLTILNGTGEGQTRRIVKAPIFDKPVADNQTGWVIDRPFDVPPGEGAFAQIYDYRGRVIWYANDWSDVGTFQTYGTSTDVVFANNSWVRGSKVTIEGQWRGWTPTGPGELGGAMGVGANPTMRSLVIGNTVTEGNSASLYYDGLWRQGVFDLESGGGESGGRYGRAVSPVLSWGTIFKRNVVLNGGGVRVGAAQHSPVCEHNVVHASDFGIQVNSPHDVTPLVLRKNQADVIVVDNCTVQGPVGSRGEGVCWRTPNIGPG